MTGGMMFDGLFKTADFAHHRVIFALGLVQLLLLGFMFGAFRCDSIINIAQFHKQAVMLGRDFMKFCFQLGGRLMIGIPAHRQQLQPELAFLLFQLGVFFSFFRLFLQVFELLVHFFLQVGEPFQVFPRMLHAGFGFAAPLLVFGNTRRFLDMYSQLFRLGFNHARDRALLDNGITSGTQTSTQEQVGNILSTAARTVQ